MICCVDEEEGITKKKELMRVQKGIFLRGGDDEIFRLSKINGIFVAEGYKVITKTVYQVCFEAY